MPDPPPDRSYARVKASPVLLQSRGAAEARGVSEGDLGGGSNASGFVRWAISSITAGLLGEVLDRLDRLQHRGVAAPGVRRGAARARARPRRPRARASRSGR